MAENPAPNAEFDFDAWLADGERVTHTVNLFARMALLDEIDKLKDKLVDIPQVSEDDESMAGEAPNPNTELEQQIQALEMRVWESKLAFQVVGRTSTEVDAIRDTVLKECAEDIDAAAGRGRAEAQKMAKRGGVTVASDIGALVRMGGIEQSQKVINHEINLRIVAESAHIITPSGALQPLNVERVRQMINQLGDQQVGLLVDAAYKAKDDAPKVTVPKS